MHSLRRGLSLPPKRSVFLAFQRANIGRGPQVDPSRSQCLAGDRTLDIRTRRNESPR